MKITHGVSALALTAAFSVCGAAFAQTGQQGHDTKAQTKQSSTHKMMMPNMTDEHFVEMMTKHHQHGIELAKAEESKGSSAEVKALAAKIRESQERELEELKAHQTKQGEHGEHAMKPTTGTETKPQAKSEHGEHDPKMQKHHEMMEQMTKESLAKVENATGEEVDHAFVHEMAKHHEMAIEMIAKTKFKDAELRKLSQKMAAGQKQELQELKKLQKTAK